MPTYKASYYHPSNGRVRTETVDMIDRQMVVEWIKNKGAFIVEIEEELMVRYKNHKVRVPTKALLVAMDVIAMLVGTGVVKIDQALRGAVSRVPPGKLRYMFAVIARRVENDGKVAEAFGMFPQVFPMQIVESLRAHTKSGTLDDGFTECATYFEDIIELKGNLIEASIVPSLGFLGFLGSFAMIFGFAIPKFKKVISEITRFDDLNPISKLFFAISDFVVAHPTRLALALVMVPFGIFLLLRSQKIRYALYKYAARMPLIGPMLQSSGIARFCKTYTVMANAKFNPVECIELASASCGNPWIQKAGLKVRDDVVASKHPSVGITFQKEESGAFPNEFVLAVTLGENKLAQVMGKMGVFFANDTKKKTKTLLKFVEPTMTFLIFVFAAFAALSILLPMGAAIQKIQQGL
jgi:type IV pilus assembly protein PilC